MDTQNSTKKTWILVWIWVGYCLIVVGVIFLIRTIAFTEQPVSVTDELDFYGDYEPPEIE